MQAANLVDYILKSVERYSDRNALTCDGLSMSYRQFEKECFQYCRLYRLLGLQEGDRVVIHLSNTSSYFFAVTSSLFFRLSCVNTNPNYSAPELSPIFRQTNPKIVITDSLRVKKIAGLFETEKPHILVCDQKQIFLFDWRGGPMKDLRQSVEVELPEFLAMESQIRDLRRSPQLMEKIAFLQFTGGTTGEPKAAVLRQRHILANISQMKDIFDTRIDSKSFDFIGTSPLYHAFGVTINFLVMFGYGVNHILLEQIHDTEKLIDLLKSYPPVVLNGVNTIFLNLLNNPRIREVNFSDLKISISGGMALDPSVAQRWALLTGLRISQGYGLTETTTAVTCNPTGLSSKFDSVGPLLRQTEARIVDDSGNDIETGMSGEIWVRGPQVIDEYWKAPDSDQYFSEGGWFKTGDMGFFDSDGHLIISGRRKEMILVSGFNVYPVEIERLLNTYPGVVESAVVGVKNEKSGESVKAFVVVNSEVTVDALLAYCRKNLAAYKVPRQIEFRDQIPKSGPGKILRRALS